MQFLTRPRDYDYAVVSGEWRHRRGASGARLAEGGPPRRGRRPQPRAGGRRGDRARQPAPERVAGRLALVRCRASRAGTCWRAKPIREAAPCGPGRPPRRRARAGAARRPGRRPRRLVGQGLLPGGGSGARGADPGLRGEDGLKVELVLPRRSGTCRRRSRPRSRRAGRPISCSRIQQAQEQLERWAAEGRLVDLADASAALRTSSIQDILDLATAVERPHRAGAASTRCRWARDTNHVHVWLSLLERAGFRREDIPTEWEPFWSFWCDKVQPAVRKALGREDVWAVGAPMSARSHRHRTRRGCSSSTPTRKPGPRPPARACCATRRRGRRWSRGSPATRRSGRRAAPRPTRSAGPTAATTRPSSPSGS